MSARLLPIALALFLLSGGNAGAAQEGQDLPPSVSATKGADLFDRTQELIMHALAFSPVRYKWGGNTPETGMDCSGYVRFVFQEAAGIMLPHNAYSMSQQGKSIGRNQMRPGDLVFFNTLKRTFSHVGIYLGDNRFIHAPRTGKSVEIGSLDTSYWKQRFNGARRVLGAVAPQSNERLASND
jgi:cell wall-associated NlpC family hydrolase